MGPNQIIVDISVSTVIQPLFELESESPSPRATALASAAPPHAKGRGGGGAAGGRPPPSHPAHTTSAAMGKQGVGLRAECAN